MTGKTEAITSYLGISRPAVLNPDCDQDHLLGLIKHKQIAPAASDAADLGWGWGWGAGCWIQLVYSESQRQGCSGDIWP